MTQSILLNIAFEDTLTEATIDSLLRQCGRPFTITNRYGREGFGYLKSKINGFNAAARIVPFLVVADLDQVECPPRLKGRWLTAPEHPNLVFRIAVHQVEAWLLADRKALARFLGIPVSKVPSDADSIRNPKQFLINLARRSRKRDILQDVVPPSGSVRVQGPNYNGRLSEFVEHLWNPDEASSHSESLRRTMLHLRRFQPT